MVSRMPYQKHEDTFPPGPFLLWGFPEWKERNPLRAEQTKIPQSTVPIAEFLFELIWPLGESVPPEGPNVLALSVQIGDDRIAAELVKEAVGAFLLIRDRDVLIHVFAVARPGGDKAADDDVFLKAAQVVHLALEGRLGEHLGGFLEGGRRDEGRGGQGRLRDAEDQRFGGGGGTSLGHGLLVFRP